MLLLFNSDRFRKIARLINITPALERDIIRQQLQRHDTERRQQHLRRIGDRDNIFDGLRHLAAVALGRKRETSAPRALTSTTLLMALSKSGA